MKMKTIEKIVVGIVVFFVGALLVYYLWNWLMPVIFGLPVVTFWQSVGLSLLASCLFKSQNSSK